VTPHRSFNFALSSSSSASISAVAFPSKVLSREQAQDFIEQLMPTALYKKRVCWGRDAHGIDGGSRDGPLKASDPRLTKSYAEFPLQSMDQLTDLALPYVKTAEEKDDTITFVDVGSGCGRLVFYSSLTRPTWDVHGIEIADLLHEEATSFLNKGVESGVFSFSNEEAEEKGTTKVNSLSLHLGAAEEYSNLLRKADLILMYCTTFPATSFSPELGAMILDPMWSDLLKQHCENGCVVITTDRALDPAYGWELVERLDVENDDLFGSVGYIQILRK